MLTYDNLIPTGIKELDEYLNGGFRSGCLCYIASSPGMGKTSLAVQLAVGAAKNGKNVLFFSLEESTEHVKARIALQDGENLPITVDDTSFVTVQYIKKRLEELGNIDMVIVDYFLLLYSEEKTVNRIKEIMSVFRNLKIMAKELKIPVISITPLFRDVSYTNRRPEWSDFRRFGTIDQDADVLVFIHRERTEKENQYSELKNETEIIIAKNRYGNIGTINGIFNRKKLKFDFE